MSTTVFFPVTEVAKAPASASSFGNMLKQRFRFRYAQDIKYTRIRPTEDANQIAHAGARGQTSIPSDVRPDTSFMP